MSREERSVSEVITHPGTVGAYAPVVSVRLVALFAHGPMLCRDAAGAHRCE